MNEATEAQRLSLINERKALEDGTPIDLDQAGSSDDFFPAQFVFNEMGIVNLHAEDDGRQLGYVKRCPVSIESVYLTYRNTVGAVVTYVCKITTGRIKDIAKCITCRYNNVQFLPRLSALSVSKLFYFIPRK